jgi:hypothetical protein
MDRVRDICQQYDLPLAPDSLHVSVHPTPPTSMSCGCCCDPHHVFPAACLNPLPRSYGHISLPDHPNTTSMHLLEPETPDAVLDVGARDEHSQLGDGFMVLKDYAVITYVGRYRCVLSLWALDWFCGLGRGRETGTVVVCLSVGFPGGAERSNFVRCSTRLELKLKNG